MNRDKKMEIWKEIIATCKNGDPEYSYELFSGIIDKVEEDTKKYMHEVYNY